MHFADQSEVLALIRLLPRCVESGHPHLLGYIQDIRHWCHSLSMANSVCWHSYVLRMALEFESHRRTSNQKGYRVRYERSEA